MALIYFRKAGVYVPANVLHRYILWLVGRAIKERELREIAIGLWSPELPSTVPLKVDEALATAYSMGLHRGWIRWDTDGSRRQIFDADRRKVCKVQKDGALLTVIDEVELRKQLGGLSPRIFQIHESHMAYVEEWVSVVTPRTYSYHDLDRIRLALVEQLYRVEEWDVGSFINDRAVPFSDEARESIPELVSRMGLNSLPVSKVHGDLVQSNTSLTKGHKPVLYDWEYSRSCVVTHDVWFYLYHGLLCARASVELSYFFDELERITAWVLPKSVDLIALHLIHLYEREALLLWNVNIVDSSFALERLGESIKEARHLLSEKCIALGDVNCGISYER
ncbi:hypothetical protein Q6D67_08120 [Haliea sp. E1-2-M8]|uniref:hypothetical protein n=1 Tax=Haliea sp. E1-2-M8 TaxID=3064706 RepID=UPI0027276006|nr:hypothetical protein [Haliea sp. E1-2-M8]MDO8861665.1 hypothetical protein [Haliea sp. E1-2-M8]